MWKTFIELKSAKICVLSGKSEIQEEEFKNDLENDHNLFICIYLLIFYWIFCLQSICLLPVKDLASALFVERFL